MGVLWRGCRWGIAAVLWSVVACQLALRWYSVAILFVGCIGAFFVGCCVGVVDLLRITLVEQKALLKAVPAALVARGENRSPLDASTLQKLAETIRSAFEPNFLPYPLRRVWRFVLSFYVDVAFFENLLAIASSKIAAQKYGTENTVELAVLSVGDSFLHSLRSKVVLFGTLGVVVVFGVALFPKLASLMWSRARKK